ncbi:alpha/beta hydrolase [Yoonia sp. I 8.24]|uniref:alpha/beta hydrolase n=1 Tax=Yoonia sp. I 8.24 TaxID=1537229 RepID=UPI001EDD108D|nr:acyl-CoA thioester hydrolase/BAAT C-terminal domain-containing protein [Yoonia sp. I 8.24]MCG3267376.1 dienelactone hydrolase family protein [Yoonia sp. I 8.24]
MPNSTLRNHLIQRLGLDSRNMGFAAPRIVEVEDYLGWQIEHLIFRAGNGTGEDIPAYFLRPQTGHRPVPALVYVHAHGNNYQIGGVELTAGRPALQGPYAPDLVRAGIAALSFDLPAFGARQHPTEAARAKAHLWQGQTLFGQMLAELMTAVDFLGAHPAVAADRIGALGFSMGSTLAWWLAALDTRIRATSASCSFADLASLVATGEHDRHGIYMTVPGLLPLARSGQIAGLAAPRALQICVGLQDWSTPKAAFDLARVDLERAYQTVSTVEQLQFHVEPTSGHVVTTEMRAAVLEFLMGALID